MLKIELEQSGNTLLCRATQRGEELGRAEAEIREDTVWYRSGWLEDPEDYGLLDGLVRAAFDAARSAGVKEYFVSGEAAGTAAALGCDFPALDIAALQETLRAQGVRVHLDEL